MSSAGRPSLSGRLNHMLRRRGELVRLTLVYDDRDQPPWTAELGEGRRQVIVREGQTIEAAIMAVALAAKDRRSTSLSRGPG